MQLRRMLYLVGAIATCCFGAVVRIPGGTLTVPGTSSAGASFTFNGTLTQADTIELTQTGNPCLQYSLHQYCINGAGVITVAGTTGVGGSSAFSGTVGGANLYWTYGALAMSISGVGAVQVFPTNSGNGLGSGTPPGSLTLPATTLASLGFGTFSVSNPTITFYVADSDWSDNTGQFVLTQQPASPPGVPAPGTWLLILTALMVLTGVYWFKTLRTRSTLN
jgi:hypothetical protein